MISIIVCIFIIIVITIQLDRNSKNENQYSSTSTKVTSAATSNKLLNGDKLYDAFISYSHYDAEWVQNILVPKLESHGFTVLIDTKFIAGRFGVFQIEDGIQYCKHVIAVFTPEYFRGEWTTLENVMTQTLDPAARQRKLIPILLKETTIPNRLRIIHYRDFRKIDENKWSQLVQDLM